jgi:hypothetical protein
VLLFQSVIIFFLYDIFYLKKVVIEREKIVKPFSLSRKKSTRSYLYIHRHIKKINSWYKLAFIVVIDDVRSPRYFSATTERKKKVRSHLSTFFTRPNRKEKKKIAKERIISIDSTSSQKEKYITKANC